MMILQESIQQSIEQGNLIVAGWIMLITALVNLIYSAPEWNIDSIYFMNKSNLYLTCIIHKIFRVYERVRIADNIIFSILSR